MRMSRGRTLLRWIGVRVGLITFGLVVALVAMELLLQAAAVYTRLTGRPEPVAWLTGTRRVMCVGDSNTFGIQMSRDQTYPSYLERIWNTASPAQPVEVLNFGFPGLNSSKLRKNLPGLLETFRPELVLMLVGANDPFIVPVPIDDGVAATRSLVSLLWDYSRVFRFFYMLTRGIAEYQIDFRVEDQIGAVRVAERSFDLLGTTDRLLEAPPQWPRDLEQNVNAMVRNAEAHGARVVLLTYPSHRALYGNANGFIRRIAFDVPHIDLEVAFRTVCPRGDCPSIFLGDQHPNAVGYQLAAALVWQQLRLLGIAPAPEDEAVPFRGLDPLVVGFLEQMAPPSGAPPPR